MVTDINTMKEDNKMKINYNFRSNLLPIITLLLAFIPLVLGAGLTISLNNEVSSVLKHL